MKKSSCLSKSSRKGCFSCGSTLLQGEVTFAVIAVPKSITISQLSKDNFYYIWSYKKNEPVIFSLEKSSL